MTVALNKYEVLLTVGKCNTMEPKQEQIVALTTEGEENQVQKPQSLQFNQNTP